MDILDKSYEVGQRILAERSAQERKEKGQFLTPPAIARYMAQQLGPLPERTYLLDPAIGSGVLACAVIERALREGRPRFIHIEAFEIDRVLAGAAREELGQAAAFALSQGVRIEVNIHEQDFLLAFTELAGLSLFSAMDNVGQQPAEYDAIIANPPYFKLRRDDPRVCAVDDLLSGRTNIYTLFMSAGIELLSPEGRMCFIVPRSFCSGAYFAKFRQNLLRKSIPLHIHLFESREEAFDDVLQENLIVALRERQEAEELPEALTISTSCGIDELEHDPGEREVAFSHFVGSRGNRPYFRLPMSELDEQIIEIVDSWPGSLEKYGLQISTGPVVAFRSRSFLCDEDAVRAGKAVPLYWLRNVRPYNLIWPMAKGKKPQGITMDAKSESLLLPSANYVLLRRFSAKEDRRRLIAAPFLQANYPYGDVGLENHLNYIYRDHGELTVSEARGLSALLGSALIDRYVRIANGNTQVNATELRALPLPPLEVIAEIGERVLGFATKTDLARINQTVYDVLRSRTFLPGMLPIFMETRYGFRQGA